jgi:RND superfamily putative drug exporter
VTTTAALIASTLLPRLLSALGAWVDAGHLGARRREPTGAHWRRWALWVTEHPVRVLVIGGLPLVLLASQSYQLRTDLPRGRWLPESADSVRVLHEIDSVADGNFGQMIQLILELPAGTAIQDEAGWRATAKVVRHFAHDPRIQHVWAVTNVTVAPLGGPEILRKIPDAVRGNFVSDDGQSVLVQLLPKQGLAAKDAAALVREIRADDATVLAGLTGARLRVGGLPAYNVDYEDAIRHSMGLIVLIVIGATLLVLSLAFRSVLIPLKAVALNLTSVAAAFGAVTIVFQDGVGSRLLGLPMPMDGGFPLLPVLVFCIVFGLSMDYEVFIVARIADGRRAGLTDRMALIEGVTRTGRVITYAAAIMVLIFAAFILGEFVLIKFLGFALGVAVLLDATLIRLAVGPAMMQLAGRWNWWPGDRPPLETKAAGRPAESYVTRKT